MVIDEKDKALLVLLSKNSRESVSGLAHKLRLSRSTVKGRMTRLEDQGIISGYTIRFNEAYELSQIQAHVMLSLDLKLSARIVHSMSNMPAVKSLYTVSGIYDMIAVISAESTQTLDQTLDEIGAIEGVEKTVTSIMLSTKLER